MNDEGHRRREWFVLVYKLPAEPSRYRASVWRKLRAAGAVYLQNGAGPCKILQANFREQTFHALR